MPDTEPDAMLTTTEAAQRLGVTMRTLVYWRAKHTGPKYLRVGDGRGQVRYRASDLDAYIAQSMVAPTN